MTVKEFNDLPEATRKELLFKRGVKMSEHFAKGWIAQRYVLPGVEVCVIKKSDEYIKIVAFKEIKTIPSINEMLISRINYN